MNKDEMKKCIWCNKTEDKTDFLKIAHTIPQSLGGKEICTNVCDECNLYFGSHKDKLPSIETVLKEAFNVSRIRLIDKDQIGKNKALPRFSSTYFNVDIHKMKFSLKARYKFHQYFQENLANQLKKGIYKIYLEEIERQKKEGHLDKYDFIREFSRYNLGDYPLFYFERKHGIMLLSKSWIENPELFLEENAQFKYLVQEPGFFEFELFGHVFGIATSRLWNVAFDNYIQKTKEAKKDMFKGFKIVKKFDEIDITLSIFNN